MKYRQLIHMSTAVFKEQPAEIVSLNVFTDGAKWMLNQLNKLGNNKLAFDRSVNYTAYGLLKYGVCIFCFAGAVFILGKIHMLLIPLAVAIFYFVEVHFLFLFPMLIDGIKYPLKESIKQTYRLGLFSSMATVFCIGIFMVTGLFNISKPLRNWYIGCLAIIIWYQHDVRNRL